jgi:hypothetical protein
MRGSERSIASSPACALLPLSTHGNQSKGRAIFREQDWADFGKRFSPKVFSASEWKTNLGEKNAFVTDIISNPKIFLIGEERDLA